MVHATGSGPSCEGCQVVQPRCRHLGEGPAWATGGHRRAGFISFQARERETGEAFIPLNISRRFQRMSTQVAQIQSLCAHWLLSFCCSYLRPTFQCDFFSSTGFKNLRYRCGEMRSVCIIPESVVFFLETLFTTSSLCSQLHGCNY